MIEIFFPFLPKWKQFDFDNMPKLFNPFRLAAFFVADSYKSTLFVWILQAAKEFESELKKEPDSIEPPVDKATAVSEEEKQDAKVSSSKESVWDCNILVILSLRALSHFLHPST